MMIRFIARFIWAAGIPLAAQTQIDLRTQSKVVDFKTAQSTRPFKTGGVIPPTCSQGEMFFLTGAAAGANMYGCVVDNTWALEAGEAGTVVQVQTTGVAVGSRPILDLSGGQGVLLALSDTGQAVTIQTSLDTSYVQTTPAEQAGSNLLCASASASGTTYTCSMTPTLASYTAGMVLHFKPDLTGIGGATSLNIDALGAVAIKLADGITDPAPGDVVAGRMVEIWWDGTAFRLLAFRGPAGILGEAQPSCGAGARGRLWFVAGGTGVKDGLSVCAKDAATAYAWRTIY